MTLYVKDKGIFQIRGQGVHHSSRRHPQAAPTVRLQVRHDFRRPILLPLQRWNKLSEREGCECEQGQLGQGAHARADARLQPQLAIARWEKSCGKYPTQKPL